MTTNQHIIEAAKAAGYEVANGKIRLTPEQFEASIRRVAELLTQPLRQELAERKEQDKFLGARALRLGRLTNTYDGTIEDAAKCAPSIIGLVIGVIEAMQATATEASRVHIELHNQLTETQAQLKEAREAIEPYKLDAERWREFNREGLTYFYETLVNAKTQKPTGEVRYTIYWTGFCKPIFQDAIDAAIARKG